MYPSWASLIAQLVKNPPAMQKTWVQFLGWEDPLEKEKLSTPVFWPGEFHGLRSPWGRKESDTTEQLALHCVSFRPQLRWLFLWAALPDFLSQRGGSLLGPLAPCLPCHTALPGPGCLFSLQDCELPEGRDCVYISIFSFSL